MSRALTGNFKPATATKLQPLTLPNFSGGLDGVSNDAVMTPDFAVEATNVRRTPGGGQKVRFGSGWFSDVSDVATGAIVDQTYFAGTIISVTTTGQVVATDSDGDNTLIWSTAIAVALPSHPSGWSTGLVAVSFVPFKSRLTIHNGVDKPISISNALVVIYLQDQGTGSNVNVPIGLLGCVVSNYHCVAGIPAALTTVYVSSKGTDGTFPGDAPPNDSISIDVGAYAPQGAPTITGIAGFRSFLIVFFLTQAVVITLGVYDDAGTHTPQFPDTIPNYGLLNHRCVVPIQNDLVFAGLTGLYSAKRSLLVNTVDSTSLSDRIEPIYRKAIGALTDNELANSCYIINDSIGHETTLHTPNGAFVFSANDKLHYRAWSQYANLNYTCGCVSFLGRVFYCDGTRIFKQGNDIFDNESYNADREGDRDGEWQPSTHYFVGDVEFDIATNEVFACTVEHISGANNFHDDRVLQAASPKWSEYRGIPVAFRLELPWITGRTPMQVKRIGFASFLTKGTAEFVVKAFVDNLYKSPEGDIVYDPALTITLIGNDAVGFGRDAGPYGGGRRSSDPRLYKFPLKFKYMKLVFESVSTEPITIGPLEFINASFLFSRGSFHR